MSAAALRELAGTPLLGAGRERAAGLLAALGPADAPEWLIQGWTGVLLFHSSRLGAVERLLAAVRGAEDAGERQEALRFALYAARALAAVGRAASGEALLEPLLPALEASPALAADLRLTRAALGQGEVRRHWEEALARLPSPARDADRLEALLGLGVLARGGGDATRARRCWTAALALAAAHGDARERLRLSALLGNALVEAGLLVEAEPVLADAVALAAAQDEALILLAEGTVLAALQLRREAWAEAEATALRLAEAARRRNNLPAIADAAITRSSARLGQGDARGAVLALWEAARVLGERGSQAGMNLVKARLAELRVQLGPATFDPVWVSVSMGRG